MGRKVRTNPAQLRGLESEKKSDQRRGFFLDFPFYRTYQACGSLPFNKNKRSPNKSGIILNVQNNVTNGFPKAWTVAGCVLLSAAAVFVGRIVYEETILTWLSGPQMVGFAMMHGALPFILIVGFIGLPGTLLWVTVSLVLLIRRKFQVPAIDWIPMILSLLLAARLFIPYEAWEEFMVRIAGPGSHRSSFLVQAAAQDKGRFVTLLLRKGYDVNYED